MNVGIYLLEEKTSAYDYSCVFKKLIDVEFNSVSGLTNPTQEQFNLLKKYDKNSLYVEINYKKHDLKLYHKLCFVKETDCYIRLNTSDLGKKYYESGFLCFIDETKYL